MISCYFLTENRLFYRLFAVKVAGFAPFRTSTQPTDLSHSFHSNDTHVIIPQDGVCQFLISKQLAFPQKCVLAITATKIKSIV